MADTMVVPDDWKEFLRLLNSHGVEYLVVGAHALAYHGYPRFTGDFDLFVSVSSSNAERLHAALLEFGFGEVGISALELSQPDKVFMLGRIPNRIDILTSITGVDFAPAYSRSVQGEIGGVPVRLIARADLVRNKEAAARHKDLDDLERLGKDATD